MGTSRAQVDYAALMNIDAEASVLGAVFVHSEIIYELSDSLRPDDFYREAHRLLYTVLLKMAQSHKAIDIVSVTEELREAGVLEKVGGIQFVTCIANSVPTSAYWKHHAEIIKGYAQRRTLCDLADTMRTAACNLGEDVDMADIQSRLARVSMSDAREGMPKSMMDEMVAYSEWEEKQVKNGGSGVMSGFVQLDIKTHGWQPGDLIVIAARPSMGKSALALSMAVHAATQAKKHVAYFSLEMSKQQLISRMLANLSGINSNIISHPADRQQADWDKLLTYKEELAKATLHLFTEDCDTPLKIYSKARQVQGKYGLDLIIVDHMHLMTSGRKGDGANRVQEMSYISRQLKLMAMEFDVPVIALAQLSRAVENRDNKHPRLSDLRDSGSIEQDADIVLLMYRDAYYRPGETQDDEVELNIAKFRNGPLSSVTMKFVKETARFEKIPFDAQTVPKSEIPI